MLEYLTNACKCVYSTCSFHCRFGDEFPGSYEKLSIQKRRHFWEGAACAWVPALKSSWESDPEVLTCSGSYFLVSLFICLHTAGRWKWILLRKRGSFLWLSLWERMEGVSKTCSDAYFMSEPLKCQNKLGFVSIRSPMSEGTQPAHSRSSDMI